MGGVRARSGEQKASEEATSSAGFRRRKPTASARASGPSGSSLATPSPPVSHRYSSCERKRDGRLSDAVQSAERKRERPVAVGPQNSRRGRERPFPVADRRPLGSSSVDFGVNWLVNFRDLGFGLGGVPKVRHQPSLIMTNFLVERRGG